MESILTSTNAVVEALHSTHHLGDLLTISGTGLVIAAGMWWAYFAREHRLGENLGSSLLFGYFHFVIFAAAGAFLAGVEVAVTLASGDADIPRATAAATLAVPVAVFLALVGASVVLPGPPIGWIATGVVLAVVATEIGDVRSTPRLS